MCIHRPFCACNQKTYKSSYKRVNVHSSKVQSTVTGSNTYVGGSECTRKDFVYFHFITLAILLIVHTGTWWSDRSVLKIRVTTWTNAAAIQIQIMLHCV
jgi:hypothetical protein